MSALEVFRYRPLSEVSRLLDRLLGAESETIAGLGHFCMKEAPHATNTPSVDAARGQPMTDSVPRFAQTCSGRAARQQPSPPTTR
jgi:hypothetical protein